MTVHSLYIVEDDPYTRAHLAELVEQDVRLTVAGQAGDLAGARADWQTITNCNAALVDLGLPDGDGADLISELSQQPNAPSVLVISVFGDERRVVRAIKAGASGYLLKDSDEKTLADSIVRTIGGECPINPSIARHLLKLFHTDPLSADAAKDQAQPALESPITARETDVLTLIARGFKNAEVAKALDMTTNTVTTHTKSIYRKLAVSSRSEAVFEATQLGLIQMNNNEADRNR